MLCRRGDGVQDEALRGPQPVRAVHEDDGKSIQSIISHVKRKRGRFFVTGGGKWFDASRIHDIRTLIVGLMNGVGKV